MVVAALGCGAADGPTRALAFFGLFGGEEVPEPSAASLPYEVTFEIRGDEDAEDALRQASNVYKLRREPPPDGDALVQRIEADFAPLIDALWSEGYYNARVVVSVAGAPLEIGLGPEGPAVRAANALKGRARVPVRIVAETGPRFTLRRVEALDSRTRLPIPPADLPPAVVRLAPGDPARTADLRATLARITDHYRRRSFPLVKAPPPAPVVDHAALSMDLTFLVDPGPRAGIGAVSLKGPETFPADVVRSFIYLEPGDPYSPKALDDTRKAVASIPAVGSVRIREADRLDRDGNLPIFVEVTDRAPNLVGFSAGFSTLDGPTSRAFYEHRNLFGEAERLRFEASTFLAPRNDGSRLNDIGDFRFPGDVGSRFVASFLKPALSGSRADLLIDGIVERNRTGGGRFGGYTVRRAGGTGAIRYRLNESVSANIGIGYEQGRTSDVISNVDYGLLNAPISVQADTTDNTLDPTTGFKLKGSVTPFIALDRTAGPFYAPASSFTRATAEASTYFAFDEAARYVLAGRVGIGGFLDAPRRLEEIPSNYRFYVGGANSVRGYRVQSISPRGPRGFVIGGRSSFEANLEARIKVTDTIGIVPFFDVGGAYSSRVPDFGDDTQMAAGLGLRYYTGIGPIRLDVAVPVNPRRGDRDFALYVSIGQAF